MNHQNNDGWEDPEFSRLRAIDLPPEAIISQGIRDTFAQLDEKTPSRLAKVAKMSLALPVVALRGVMLLELEVIKLRQEVRQLRGE